MNSQLYDQRRGLVTVETEISILLMSGSEAISGFTEETGERSSKVQAAVRELRKI